MANYEDIKKATTQKATADANAAKQAASNAYKAAEAEINARNTKAKADATANYRQAKGDLKRNLGSVSQTTYNKLNVNYGRNMAAAENARTTAIASAKSAYDAATSKANESAAKRKGEAADKLGRAQVQKEATDKKNKQAIRDAKLQMKTEKAQKRAELKTEKSMSKAQRTNTGRRVKVHAKDTRAQIKENRKKQMDAIKRADKRATAELKDKKRQADLMNFKDSVGRYNTKKKINKAIKKLKASSDPDKWVKIGYLQSQKSKLNDFKKSGGGGGWHSWGGGGWGRGGWGRSYSSGGSGTEELSVSSTPTKEKDSTAKNAYKKAASKKSSGGGKKIIPTKLGYNVGGAKTGKPLATKRKSNGRIARTRSDARRHGH